MQTERHQMRDTTEKEATKKTEGLLGRYRKRQTGTHRFSAK